MIKAVLFDLDGTLADTLFDLADAANAVLSRCGFPPHPTESYRLFVGNGAKVLMERASGVSPSDQLDELLSAFVEEYDRRCMERTVEYDGVTDTLNMLHVAGIRTAIVTNKPARQAKRIVEHLFAGAFEHVFGAAPDYPKKPDPTAALLAAKALGVLPQECVFVGDSAVDVETAHAAGMACIGCCFGFRGEEELRAAGADDFVYSFGEIQKNRLIFT